LRLPAPQATLDGSPLDAGKRKVPPGAELGWHGAQAGEGSGLGVCVTGRQAGGHPVILGGFWPGTEFGG